MSLVARFSFLSQVRRRVRHTPPPACVGDLPGIVPHFAG